MASLSDDLLDQIRRISGEGGSLQDYEVISAALSSFRKTELEQILRKCDVVGLFTSMDLHQSAMMQVAITLATTVFSVIPLVQFIHENESEVLSALNSKNADLIGFLLNKVASDTKMFGEDVACIPEIILDAILGLLISENIAISEASIRFLKCIGNLKNGPEAIFHSPKFTQLMSNCSKPEYSIRLCEMSVALLHAHPEIYDLFENSGVLDKVIQGLESRDPLTNLNYLEVTKPLVKVKRGYNFLELSGVIERLVTRLQDLSCDTFRTLLLPGYITFFGVLSHQRPEYWFGDNRFAREFVQSLATAVSDTTSPAISLAVFDSLGYVVSSIEGRHALNIQFATNGTLSVVFPKIGKLLHDSPAELCVRVVDCISEFLRNPLTGANEAAGSLDSRQLCNEALLSFSWAAAIGSQAAASAVSCQDSESMQIRKTAVGKVAKRLISMAHQPYMEIRLAALKALHAISTQLWGVRTLMDEPGFMEYLLNRTTEDGLSKIGEALQTKFHIISTILITAEIHRDCDLEAFEVLLRPQQAICLRSYVRQGIWGTPETQSTIAIEPS